MPVDLNALNRILPGHRIQTEPVALISGALAGSTLELLVPPAGWPVVMVEPEPALTFCLVQAGMTPEQAGAVAEKETCRLRRDLPVNCQPILMGVDEKWRRGVPTAAVVEVLDQIGPHERNAAAALVADAVKVSRAKRIMPEINHRIGPYSVADLVSGPAPEAWTEAWFMFGTAIASDAYPARPFGPVPTFWETDAAGRNRDEFEPAVLAWVTRTIEVAAEIARVKGQPVFYPPGWWNDVPYSYHGDVHRWLMLDFACYAMPQSAFVEQLVRVSGAPDVTSLRSALQLPSSIGLEKSRAGSC